MGKHIPRRHQGISARLVGEMFTGRRAERSPLEQPPIRRQPSRSMAAINSRNSPTASARGVNGAGASNPSPRLLPTGQDLTIHDRAMHGRDLRLKPGPHLAHPPPAGMAMPIVDPLQAIEINEPRRQLSSGNHEQAQPGGQVIQQQATTESPGQASAGGFANHLLLGDLCGPQHLRLRLHPRQAPGP